MNPPATRPSGNVLVDARCVRVGATGVGRYVAGLLQGLEQVLPFAARAPRITAMHLPGEEHALGGVLAGLRTVRRLPMAVDYADHPTGDIFLHWGINNVMARGRFDTLVSPFFHAPAGPRPFARVVGLLDDLVWTQPDSYPRAFRALIRFEARAAVPWAERVITMSGAAARGIARELGDGVLAKTRVVPGGVDLAGFHPAGDGARGGLRRALRVPEDGRALLVYVASFEARKNHEVLLRGLRPLADRVRLVLLGAPSRADRARLAPLARGMAVRLAGMKDHAAVAAWLRAADLAVFPSRAEGFGLPVLEALACGTPVVASRIAPVREIAGPCARYASPDDPRTWTEAVAAALAAPPDAAERRRLRARAERFTWAAAARALLEALP
jgi:glycosyltransferase involved in cell wall biosynthesis